MKVIGLTGNRLSGKKTILKEFQKLGVPTFNLDTLIKYLINYDTDTVKSIETLYGSGIYMMGMLVEDRFNSDTAFNELIDLVDHKSNTIFREWALSQNSDYVVCLNSMLFERGMQKRYDRVCTVFAPLENRIKRGVYNDPDKGPRYWRDLLSDEYDEYEKNMKSDWVIHNYDDLVAPSKYVSDINKEMRKFNIFEKNMQHHDI